jgi:hypothetical protein
MRLKRSGISPGYVLHTGPGVYSLGEKLWAVPIAALWQPEIATTAKPTS